VTGTGEVPTRAVVLLTIGFDQILHLAPRWLHPRAWTL
jgi:hypothetical protein